MYLAGLKSNLDPVPAIPSSVTGWSVYGHIITDEHRDHFRRLHPDVEAWQSGSPLGLVSIASLFTRDHKLQGDVTKVYDDGQFRTCLVYVDYRGPGRLYDYRWKPRFTEDLEKELGITGIPKWYPRDAPVSPK